MSVKNNFVMKARNQFLGELEITEHAMERWMERGTGDSIIAIVLAASPFGGQSGNDMLLENGNVVFAVRDRRKVVTVLTRDMAMVNVQAFYPNYGRQVYDKKTAVVEKEKVAEVKPLTHSTRNSDYKGGLVSDVQPDYVPPSPKNPKLQWDFTTKELERIKKIMKSSDEQLKQMREIAQSQTRNLIDWELQRRQKTREKENSVHGIC